MAERGAVNLVVVSSTLTPSAIQRETRLEQRAASYAVPKWVRFPLPLPRLSSLTLSYERQ